jgi:hypothetical protein
MTSPAGRLERRGAAAIVLGSFVAGGVVFVFAGTLTRATELEAEAARVRAEVAVLGQREDAGLAELEFIETDRFVEQQARAAGYGRPGEQAFSLPEDAPPPPRVVPLGEAGSMALPSTPFDAWMGLLFGARDAQA